MKPTIIFKRDRRNVKKQFHLKNGVLLIYALRKRKINSMQFERFDAEITTTLLKDFQRYFTSKFKTNKTVQVCDHKQRIWVGILNRFLTNKIIIKKDKPFSYFCSRTWSTNKNEKIHVKNIEEEEAKKVVV